MNNFFEKYFKDINSKINSVEIDNLIDVAKKIKNASSTGNKLIIVGNGGSAAIASHLAVDFTKSANIRAGNYNEAD